jgi:hypothetical protein
VLPWEVSPGPSDETYDFMPLHEFGKRQKVLSEKGIAGGIAPLPLATSHVRP